MDTSSAAKQKTEDIVVPKGKMFIKVYAPFRNYYEGFAESISGSNASGPFDILPGHHKFLSLLNSCDLVIRTGSDSEDETVKIDKGVMFVKEDRVTVFLDV